jgi:hypothetical protein
MRERGRQHHLHSEGFEEIVAERHGDRVGDAGVTIFRLADDHADQKLAGFKIDIVAQETEQQSARLFENPDQDLGALIEALDVGDDVVPGHRPGRRVQLQACFRIRHPVRPSIGGVLDRDGAQDVFAAVEPDLALGKSRLGRRHRFIPGYCSGGRGRSRDSPHY